MEFFEENGLEVEYLENEEIRKLVEKFYVKFRNNCRYGIYIYVFIFNNVELNLKVVVYNLIYCGFEFFDKKGNYLKFNNYFDEV